MCNAAAVQENRWQNRIEWEKIGLEIRIINLNLIMSDSVTSYYYLKLPPLHQLRIICPFAFSLFDQLTSTRWSWPRKRWRDQPRNYENIPPDQFSSPKSARVVLIDASQFWDRSGLFSVHRFVSVTKSKTRTINELNRSLGESHTSIVQLKVNHQTMWYYQLDTIGRGRKNWKRRKTLSFFFDFSSSFQFDINNRIIIYRTT